MQINKIGDIVINEKSEYIVPPELSIQYKSYFTPQINPLYANYQPASSFGMGTSVYFDYIQRLNSQQELKQYSPSYCKFGDDFKLNMSIDLIGALTPNGDSLENIRLFMRDFYRDAGVPNYNDFPSSPYFQTPKVYSEGSPLILDEVLISTPLSGTNVYGLYIEGIDLQPEARIILSEARGNCGLIGKLMPVINEELYYDSNADIETLFTGELLPSDDPVEYMNGIFRGYIDINISVKKQFIVNELSPDETYCGSFIEESIPSVLRLRVRVRSGTYIKDALPPLLNVYNFNNGNIEKLNFYGDPDYKNERLNNINCFVRYFPNSNTYVIIYRSAIMQSGINDRPYYTLFAVEIYKNLELASREIYASNFYADQNIYDFDKSPLDNSVSSTAFAEVLNQLGFNPISFGTYFDGQNFIIPAYNLDLVDKEKRYELKFNSQYKPDNGFYYTFNSGLYTALIDPKNSHVYFILADGGGYYDCNLSDSLQSPLFNFIKLDEENFIVGVMDKDVLPVEKIKYYLFNFDLIQFKIKPSKIIYDFNKIAVSFIPCHTHCMGKGGIISKV